MTDTRILARLCSLAAENRTDEVMFTLRRMAGELRPDSLRGAANPAGETFALGDYQVSVEFAISTLQTLRKKYEDALLRIQELEGQEPK